MSAHRNNSDSEGQTVKSDEIPLSVASTVVTKQDVPKEVDVETSHQILDLEPITSETSDDQGEDEFLTDRPVIGILTQPYNQHESYIMATYVKFVETGAAIPIPFDVSKMSDRKIIKFMRELNGVVIPGGAQVFQYEDGSITEWVRRVGIVYEEAKRINEQEGSYFPVFGICQGFQLIHLLEVPDKQVLEYNIFDGVNMLSDLQWAVDPQKTRLYKDLDPEVLKSMAENKLTHQNHKNGVRPETYEAIPELAEAFEITSTAKD